MNCVKVIGGDELSALTGKVSFNFRFFSVFVYVLFFSIQNFGTISLMLMGAAFMIKKYSKNGNILKILLWTYGYSHFIHFKTVTIEAEIQLST